MSVMRQLNAIVDLAAIGLFAYAVWIVVSEVYTIVAV